MPAEVIGSGVVPPRTNPQVEQSTPGATGPAAPPAPTPNPTEDRIKEIQAQIEALQREIERIKQQRENAYKESSSQILLAEALRNSEEAQRDDSPPVDEFDQNSNTPAPAYSMSDALRLRTISTLRDLVYGDSLGNIRDLNTQISDLQKELRDLQSTGGNANQTPPTS